MELTDNTEVIIKSYRRVQNSCIAPARCHTALKKYISSSVQAFSARKQTKHIDIQIIVDYALDIINGP